MEQNLTSFLAGLDSELAKTFQLQASATPPTQAQLAFLLLDGSTETDNVILFIGYGKKNDTLFFKQGRETIFKQHR